MKTEWAIQRNWYHVLTFWGDYRYTNDKSTRMAITSIDEVTDYNSLNINKISQLQEELHLRNTHQNDREKNQNFK